MLFSKCFVVFFLILWSLASLAARNATVVSEKAVIWADVARTTPLGYASRGKVLRVGEIQRDKNQVLPVIVSGKLAYISVEDISFAEEDRKRAVESVQASRFEKNIGKKQSEVSKRVSVGFSQSFSNNEDSYYFGGGEALNDFVGLQMRSDFGKNHESLHVGFMAEGRQSTGTTASLRYLSLGVGASWHLIKTQKLKMRLESFLLGIPYAQLQESNLFRINGYGVSALAQASLDLIITREWGIEFNAGLEATKLFGFRVPAPFRSFSPTFLGTRVGASLVRDF